MYFTKPPQLKEQISVLSYTPARAAKFVSLHMCSGMVCKKTLHVAILVCYVWKYKLFTPDMPDQFLQETSKQNIDTLYI